MSPNSVIGAVPEMWSRLRAALVSDALDAVGLRHQCLRPGISPLVTGGLVVGRAFTVTAMPTDTPAAKPYRGLLRALDAVGTGDVFVYPTDRSDRAAVWGELVSTSALARGVVGVVTDGLVRDAARIRQLGLPVFCRGTLPYDVNGRLEVVNHGEVATIDGVRVAPGDLVVADDDGVVIIPTEVEAEVIERCLAKDALEDRFREAVRQGEPAGRAFKRLQVL
jgi:4-hydroxy-4-methyl-2-oxoglutarate aldolase